MFRRVLRHRFYLALGFILATLLLGVIGFHAIEGRSWVDSLYLVVQILSTVGLDKQTELTFGGRVFVIVLIVVFLTGFTLAASMLVHQMVVEGHTRLRDRWRERKVAKMRNHYIVCGYGRLGSHTVSELTHFGCEVVVIEADPQLVEVMVSEHGVTVLQGDATEDAVLQRAQIQDARGLLAALPDDADNVFVTLTARELNPHIRIVARSNSEKTRRKLQQAGAERLVLPHEMGGRRMAYALMRPLLADFIDRVMGEGGQQRLEQWTIPPDCDVVGKTIREAQIRSRYSVSVLGLARQGKELEIAGSSNPVLEVGDILIVLGRADKIQAMPSAE